MRRLFQREIVPMDSCNRIIEFSFARASSADILGHLRACSSYFDPPLGDRVQLDQYAEKLARSSVTFEAWDDKVLIGLVAAYLDGKDTPGQGFITNVSVMPEYQGRGIARDLVRLCHRSAKEKRLERVRLHVSPNSQVAVDLYSKLGYEPLGQENSRLVMEIRLEKQDDCSENG